MKNILTQSLAKYFLPAGNVSSTGYNFNLSSSTGTVAMLNAQRSALKIIEHFFSPIKVLASKPVITVTTDKVVINVFYYMPVENQALNNNTINNLGDVLGKLFGQPVELRLTKLYYPYLNSYILAQYIALNTQNYKFVRIQRMIFGKVSIVKDTESDKALASQLPSHIVGIKIRVSGRLATERSRPRQTVQTSQVGSFVKGNKSLVDIATYTSKNKKGAFTVKVWISQRVSS